MTHPSIADRAKFDLDLSVGEAWEQGFLGLIQSGKVECKVDRLARRTGNIFIEYECRGKPSGLAVTQAEWWAIGIEGDNGEVESAILVSVPWLKRKCRPLYRSLQDVHGGDDLKSRGIILRLSDLP